MSTNYAILRVAQPERARSGPALAASITREASTQTYYTILLLADRDRVADAYRAYAYFRWVDDMLDGDGMDDRARRAFVERQQALIERCYRGDQPGRLADEEWLLADLIGADDGQHTGLQTYIRDMMAVMAFDAGRRGQLISAAALNQYTSWLATAVTECMHYFIGHGCDTPRGEARCAAVTAAHIVHMLRDTIDDGGAGYFNIPREVVEAQGIDPSDVTGEAYRAWVKGRVNLARSLFQRGREHLTRVENARCRFAAYAYVARFEYLLDLIERDGFHLRAAYPERKGAAAALWMGQEALAQTFVPRRPATSARALSYR